VFQCKQSLVHCLPKSCFFMKINVIQLHVLMMAFSCRNSTETHLHGSSPLKRNFGHDFEQFWVGVKVLEPSDRQPTNELPDKVSVASRTPRGEPRISQGRQASGLRPYHRACITREHAHAACCSTSTRRRRTCRAAAVAAAALHHTAVVKSLLSLPSRRRIMVCCCSSRL
jgi:hypothetical protein